LYAVREGDVSRAGCCLTTFIDRPASSLHRDGHATPRVVVAKQGFHQANYPKRPLTARDHRARPGMAQSSSTKTTSDGSRAAYPGPVLIRRATLACTCAPAGICLRRVPSNTQSGFIL